MLFNAVVITVIGNSRLLKAISCATKMTERFMTYLCSISSYLVLLDTARDKLQKKPHQLVTTFPQLAYFQLNTLTVC